jgi:hypothetical protein
MSLAVIRALVASGAPADAVLTAIDAHADELREADVRRRAAVAKRVAAHRARAKDVTDVTHVTVTDPLPLDGPSPQTPLPLNPPTPNPCPPNGGRPPVDLNHAVALFNEMAGETGLSTVQKLTDARRAALGARIRDCGGMDGWKAALTKLRSTPFLLGQNERGWKADFDFLIRESSFAKLMEGGYGNRAPPLRVAHSNDRPRKSALEEMTDAAQRYLARYE